MKVFRLLPAVLLAGLCSSGAAVIPYTNNFSGTGTNVALTESPDADWTVSGGSYVFSSTSTAIAPSVASISLINAAGVNFTMETQFTVSSIGSVNSNGQTLGFGVLGATSGFGGASGSSYYLADWQVANTSSPGNLRILALGDTTGFTNTSVSVDANLGASNLAINLDTTYTLRLTGVYVGGTLNLTLGVYDSTGTTQIGTSATASDTSPLTGTNFGYRNRIGIGGGTFNASFDNLSVVPEPTAVGLLAVGGTLVMAFRRRTKLS